MKKFGLFIALTFAISASVLTTDSLAKVADSLRIQATDNGYNIWQLTSQTRNGLDLASTETLLDYVIDKNNLTSGNYDLIIKAHDLCKKNQSELNITPLERKEIVKIESFSWSKNWLPQSKGIYIYLVASRLGPNKIVIQKKEITEDSDTSNILTLSLTTWLLSLCLLLIYLRYPEFIFIDINMAAFTSIIPMFFLITAVLLTTIGLRSTAKELVFAAVILVGLGGLAFFCIEKIISRILKLKGYEPKTVKLRRSIVRLLLCLIAFIILIIL